MDKMSICVDYQHTIDDCWREITYRCITGLFHHLAHQRCGLEKPYHKGCGVSGLQKAYFKILIGSINRLEIGGAAIHWKGGEVCLYVCICTCDIWRTNSLVRPISARNSSTLAYIWSSADWLRISAMIKVSKVKVNLGQLSSRVRRIVELIYSLLSILYCLAWTPIELAHVERKGPMYRTTPA